MSQDIRLLRRKRPFVLLYATSFLLAFHLFFVVYMNSSFLSSFVNEAYVGFIYAASSILSIISLLFITRLLKVIGNYKTLVLFTVLEFFAFLGLAFLKNVYFIIPIFVGYSVIFPILFLNFDVFIEGYAEQKSEGAIRGSVLTVVNIALVLAPLAAGLLLESDNYWKIYLVSALVLLPFMVIIRKFKSFRDPDYHDIKIWSSLTCIVRNLNLRNVMITQFLMRLLFSWMVIYAPIYLHTHIGFDWTEIGIMTAIMLLPFVFIEYPAGKLADKVLGEKELLILGFFISGLFVFLFSLTSVKDFLFWTALMFTIRVGASLIEIMTESYFFKHVDGADSNTISFFRITRPLAYLVGPIIGMTTLAFVSFQYMWLVLGFILLSGVYFASKLQDTK